MLPALIAVRPLDQRLVVLESLRRLRLKPVVFQNALTLQDQVEHNRVDLLIVDLDDTEFLLRLVELKSAPLLTAIPVVGMSVQTSSVLVEELLADVVDLFMTKPLQLDVLTEGISSVCGFGYRPRKGNWSSTAMTGRGGVGPRTDMDRRMN